MTPKIMEYVHHDAKVKVRRELKGKHRDYCLCHICGSFDPDDRDENCCIANAIFENCKKFNVVTPVWECPNFNLRVELYEEDYRYERA